MRYVNFDDERIVGIEVKDLNTLLEVLHEIYGDFDFILLDAYLYGGGY